MLSHVKRKETQEGQDQPPQKKKTTPSEPAQEEVNNVFFL
jgi:hypothetical protein